MFRGFGVEIVRLLRVNVLPVVAFAAMAVGLKLQLWLDGHERAILPEKLVGLVARMVQVTDEVPMIAEMVGFFAVRENWDRPVPERETLCGLPVALSLMLSVPLRTPLAVGAKITLAVQLWPAPRALSLIHI